ncbi:hypothetical protein DFH09DRAFT_875670, partial [Mycena vulgaris]
WAVLAQCHEDQNDHGKALQLRIMDAHLKHEAEEWDSLALQSRNVASFWNHAVLAKHLGDLHTVAFLAILARFPHDISILSELRTVLVDLGDFQTCATQFQDALRHYQ